MAYADVDQLDPVTKQRKRPQPASPALGSSTTTSPAFQAPDPSSFVHTPDTPSPDFGAGIRRTDVTPPITPGVPVNQPGVPPVSPTFGANRPRTGDSPRRSFLPDIPTQDELPKLEPRLPEGPASRIPTTPTQPPTQQTPEAPTPQPQDGWANPPQDGNWEQWFLQNVKSLPPTPQSLTSIEAQLGKHGIRVLRNAEGTAGKIQLPNGQIIDVILAAGLGGRGWQWLTPEQGGNAPSPGQPGSGGVDTAVRNAIIDAIAGGGGASIGEDATPTLTQLQQQVGGAEQAANRPPTLGEVTSNLSNAGLTGFQESVRQMILDQLSGLSQPVDPNDPNVRLPINDAERRAEQIRRRRQAADAERLTQKGIGDSGALDTARRQGFEDLSQTVSGITAEILNREMSNKRKELQDLLRVAMASGDSDSAMQVQRQLATLDAELRKLGLSQQKQQFGIDAGIRLQGLDQQQAQFLTDAELRRLGLDRQQGQFDDQMDLEWARHLGGLL